MESRSVQTAAVTRGWVPLSALGEFELKPEIGGITRYNGLRTNVVEGYTRNGALPIDVAHQVLAELRAEGFELPPGYRIELGGAVEKETEKYRERDRSHSCRT